jgi:acetylornithine aminotransferase
LVKIPPAGIVNTLAKIVHENGGFISIDEVTTGLGRTGKWFGFQHYSFQPDIISLGKGLGNGYPVSAVVMTKEIAEKLSRTSFHHAQSHQNDPLACAVAKEVIQTLQDEELIEQSVLLGERFLAQLNLLKDEFDIIREVRGRGLMLVVEFKKNERYFSLSDIYYKMMESGFIAGFKPEANLLRFYPPLTIKRIDIDNLISCMRRILKAL